MEVRKLINKENNFEEISEKLLSDTKHFAFVYHFSEDKIRNLVLDKSFIEKLLEYTEKKDGHNNGQDGYLYFGFLLNFRSIREKSNFVKGNYPVILGIKF